MFVPLRDLLGRVYGVPAVIAEEFGRFNAHVMIFGSFAARWEGVPGPTPRDVDVIVIGDVDPLEVWDAAAQTTSRLGMEVNVVLREEKEWDQEATGFARQVKAEPVIEVHAPTQPAFPASGAQ